MSAQGRREEILAAAMSEFSEKGFHGASTVTIAERVGISHPNLFRLFPTKKALFIATIERMHERLKRGMIDYGHQNPENPLLAMAHGYHDLLANRELMLLLLQGYAACDDEEIREVMRRVSAETFMQVEGMPGVSTRDAVEFYARGMLLTVAAAMRLPEIAANEEWARKFLD
jgi:AcrR family transcriptional regulator